MDKNDVRYKLYLYLYLYIDRYIMEYYSTIKKERKFAICNNIDGPEGYYA